MNFPSLLATMQTLAPFSVLVATKATLLLAVAALLTLALRRRSAAARHLVWSLAVGGVTLLPLAMLAMPEIPVLPAAEVVASAPDTGDDVAGVAPSTTLADPSDARAPAAEPAPSGDVRSIAPSVTLTQSFLALWFAGVLFVLARFAFGFLQVRGIARRAVPAVDPEWAALAGQLARRAGMGTVALRISDEVDMPFASGLIAPIVILPAAALEWTADRREAVLAHELAHLSRGDLIMNTLSHVARALYWFNPLAWYAAHRLRIEGERAADDVVLQRGARASDYADHLLSIASSTTAGLPGAALAMARRSAFEGRLLAILEPGVERAAPSRMRVAFSTLGLLAIILPLAGASPTARAAAMPIVIAQEPAATEPLSAPTVQQQQAERTPVQEPAPTTAVGALIGALSDANAAVRLAAVGSLGSLEDPRAIAALGKALREDSDPRVRQAAAAALGEIDDPRAVPHLVSALGSEKVGDVRQEIVEALASIDDPAALPAVMAVTGDAHVGVRRAAVRALNEFEEQAAVPALLAMVRDQDAEVRQEVADALGSLENKSALDALVTLSADAVPDVRVAAISALSNLEDPRALNAFVGALKDANADVRSHAADAIDDIPDIERAPRALIDALADPNAEVRHNVAHALGNIGDEAAVPALKRALGDTNVEVRRAVAEALADIGGADAITALMGLLKDPDPEIRKTAAEALGKRR